jgi:hypothetical protein
MVLQVDFGEFVQSAKLLTQETAARDEEISPDVKAEAKTLRHPTSLGH